MPNASANAKHSQNGTEMEANCAQNLQNVGQNWYDVLVTLLRPFSKFLAPFWASFWDPFGLRDRSKNH